MNKYAGFEPSDYDRTDELPVLSEESIVAAGGTVPVLDDIADDDATGEHPILFATPVRHAAPEPTHDAAALAVLQEALNAAQREIAESRAERTRLAAALDERNREVGLYKGEVERQRAQLTELRSVLDEHRQSRAALEDQLAQTKHELGKQARLAAESAAAADKLQPYRDEIQALTAYIAGSRERWKEMEGVIASHTERISDLQRELEHRIERQQASEQATHAASAQVAELKSKLAEAMTTLRARESDLVLLKRAKGTERAERHALDAKLAERDAKLAERDAMLAEAGDAAAALERRLTVTEAELQRLRADYAQVEKRLADKNVAAGAQDARISSLQRELSERIAALQKMQLPASAPPAGTSPSPRGPAAAADHFAATSAFPILVCLTSEKPEKHVIADTVTTIGRGPECAIRILTQFVSRVHARLTRENGRIVIEDCGSTNGVFVNSVRVDRRQLEHGDWVTIGETQFRFLNVSAG